MTICTVAAASNTQQQEALSTCPVLPEFRLLRAMGGLLDRPLKEKRIDTGGLRGLGFWKGSRAGAATSGRYPNICRARIGVKRACAQAMSGWNG